ncbi:hypothetical protein KD5_32610 [Yersinia pseudotuberculosis]
MTEMLAAASLIFCSYPDAVTTIILSLSAAITGADDATTNANAIVLFDILYASSKFMFVFLYLKAIVIIYA